MKRFALNAMGDSMKLYVLIETCCKHFEGVYTQEEFDNIVWNYEEEKDGRDWYVYEIKDGKAISVEYIPAKE